MRRRLPPAVVLVSLFAAAAFAQARSAVDWIFLVDTSASMRGAGGTENVFDDVKASIKTFVDEAKDDDSISVLTFDRDVRIHSPMTIARTARADLHAIVDGLEANGNRTHLGLAIAKGLERARQTAADPKRVRAIVLFTDGKEDVRGIRDPVPIMGNVEQVGDSYVFFVSVGDLEPKLEEFVRRTRRSEIVRAATRESIHEVANKIRKRVDPPPPPLQVTLSPSTINLGKVTAGKTSDERSLTITSNRPARVKLKVTAPDGVSVRVAEAVDVPAVIEIRATVAEDATPGPREITISAHRQKVTATLEVIEPPLAIRVAKIAIPIAVVALIALVLLMHHRRNHRLEGALEILEPRLPSDAAYIGLPHLQASEVALSTIVPPDALNGEDARLFVRRRDGKKKVWIAARTGSLRINDVETPLGELYDADTIRVGAAKLRFNRIGDERAAGREEEL